MSRIGLAFAALQARGEAALVPFFTAGDPDLATTRDLVRAAVDAGAHAVELGVPFSDPMADGPVLQRAAARALTGATSLPRVLELVADLRQEVTQPIVLFGYYNPFFRYGLDRIATDAAAAGADGVLCVDLPPEEAGDLRTAMRATGLDLIALVAPTTPIARVRRPSPGCARSPGRRVVSSTSSRCSARRARARRCRRSCRSSSRARAA